MNASAITIHLVLTHHWFAEMESGRKCVEYRANSAHWLRLIWNRRERITHVRFSDGYSKRTITRPVEKIELGPCPIPGWSGTHILIHFLRNYPTS